MRDRRLGANGAKLFVFLLSAAREDAMRQRTSALRAILIVGYRVRRETIPGTIARYKR